MPERAPTLSSSTKVSAMKTFDFRRLIGQTRHRSTTSLFADYAAVTAAMHQVGSDVVITHDAAQSVVLHDVSLSALSAADFLLI
jgi:selenocysteine lyase/cysteine desulfurase